MITVTSNNTLPLPRHQPREARAILLPTGRMPLSQYSRTAGDQDSCDIQRIHVFRRPILPTRRP